MRHAWEFILYWSYQQFKNIQLLVSQNTVGPDSVAQWNWLAQTRSIPHRTSIPQKNGKGSTSIFPYTHCTYSISIQEQLKSWAASVYMFSKGSRVSLKMPMVPAPRRPRHRIQRSSKTQVDRKLKVSLSNIRFCLKPLHHSLTSTQHRGSMPSLAWNSQYKLGWSWTQRSTWLCFTRDGIKGIYHHAQFSVDF